jgi:hypothetical protein
MTTVTIKNNKLLVTCNGITEEITIYKFIQECDSFKLHLCKKFRILNYLFTLQRNYIPKNPRGILRGTVYTTSYVSTSTPGPDCPYLVWNEKVLQLVPLSRAVAPRREIIQLYQNNYRYRIHYRSNRKIRFLNLIPANNAAYPLIDPNGNTLQSVIGEGSFTTLFWTLIVVQLLPGENRDGMMVELDVTAEEKVKPIAAETGDICLQIPTKNCGTVSVKVATKFTNGASIAQVPVPELASLAEMLHGGNRTQSYPPCFGTEPIVDPPGPFFVIPNTGGIPFDVTIPLLDKLIFIRSVFGSYFIITMPERIPENLAADVGDHIPELGQVSSAMWLKRRGLNGEGKLVRNVTYKISYYIEIIYRGARVLPDTTFWIASESGPAFTEYNPLCQHPYTDTKDGNSVTTQLPNGDTVAIFEKSYRINNSCGDYFQIGFYPGTVLDNVEPIVNISENSWIRAEVDTLNQTCQYGECGAGSLK